MFSGNQVTIPRCSRTFLVAAAVTASVLGCTSPFDPEPLELPDCEFPGSNETCGEARQTPRTPSLPYSYQPNSSPRRAIIGG
jgi:hypothetical protein